MTGSVQPHHLGFAPTEPLPVVVDRGHQRYLAPTEQHFGEPARPPSQELPARASTLRVAAVALLIAGIAAALRLFHLSTAYDMFIDEPFYVELAQSVAAGHLPFAAGSLFFLHPPGHSVIGALWIRLVGGVDGSIVDQVLALRPLNVVFAAATAAMLFLVGRRVSSPLVGVLAATVFAISPWFIRQNSYLLLETSASTFVLAGYLILLYLPRAGRGRTTLIVLTGLLFGYGILVKEFAVFTTMLPMAIMALRGRPRGRHSRAVQDEPVLARREALLVFVLATVPYLLWCLIVVATGNFGEFWAQTAAGFSRATGATQITGFNTDHAPSFLSTLLAQAPRFWTCYLMLGLGAVAVTRLLFHSLDRLRLIGAYGFGALPLLGYSVLFGANEEQFYYHLLVPASIAVAVCGKELWNSGIRFVRPAIFGLAVLWAGSDMANWAIVHTVTDNTVQVVDEWMWENVPEGTTIAVSDSVQREIFLRYTMVNNTSLAAVQSSGAEYLVVDARLVTLGYAFLSEEEFALEQAALKLETVVAATGRESGTLYVFAIK